MQNDAINAKTASSVSPISYLYFTLFFISGISGLIYESVWSQYLKQFLGHAAYSQTLVLVIYMGGMALGSWLAAVWANRVRDLLLWYAIVEIALGVSAFAFHDFFIRYIDTSFSTILPFLGKPVLISLYKWGSSALIILPQSMLLGATFPLMAGGILRRFPGLSGYKTSFIYFVNTFGASIGVLISGFYLVREWGLKGAIISGGAIDLFVGMSILALCLSDRTENAVIGSGNSNNSNSDNNGINTGINTNTGTSINNDNTGSNINTNTNINTVNADVNNSIGTNINTDIDDLPLDDELNDISAINAKSSVIFAIPDKREDYYPLLFVACGTAVASFMYEIGWIRMLSLVLGSSTHSFELMLSAFILGLALGSFFVRNKLDTVKNAPRFLGIVQIIMGASAILTLFTYGSLFKIMVFTIDALDRNASGYILFNVISHLICMITMLPSTICAGMVIPLIINMLYRRGYGEAAIGKVYAVNTAGGILGVIIAVWGLMELTGLKCLITAGGALDMALGLYVLYKFAETKQSLTRTIAQPACLVVLVAAVAFSKLDPVLASSGVFRYGTISNAKRVVEHIDGKTASITLFKSGDNLVLSTNGKPDASVGFKEEYSSDEYTMSLLGLLPMSVRDEIRTAAVIGMGAGMTAHYLLYDPTLESLDVVEIEPAMAKLAKKIGAKVENTFNDPRCHIRFDDAKTYFAAQNRAYDVIVSEPSNPWVSGVSSLFSQEFFSHIRRHINEGGILVQWFHKYEADVTILVSILKALGESFPKYELYMAGSDLIVIAARDENTDISLKRDVFIYQPISENMKKMGFSGMDDFHLIRYADKTFFDPLIKTYKTTPANSDYHSYVDLYAAKHRFMGSSAKEIDDIREFIVPIRKTLFADTAYMSLIPTRTYPDIYNLYDIHKAKSLAQEVVFSARAVNDDTTHGSLSASIFILDYAETRPQMITFSQIQSAIVQILQKTLPYLSADETRELWDAIEGKIAKRELSETDKEWLAYFRALCGYDIPETRRMALSLLPMEADTIADHLSNQMLIASLLTASAVMRDTAKVERVWDKYEYKKRPPAAIRAARAVYSSINSSPAK
ncbi:MAG: fused MFS/spermidine synthase [Chitinispirillales bacterium]|jgi:spermidine synthase|nr:fused MFS/spermidine synthase [Chitinispirillales bacterium]